MAEPRPGLHLPILIFCTPRMTGVSTTANRALIKAARIRDEVIGDDQPDTQREGEDDVAAQGARGRLALLGMF